MIKTTHGKVHGKTIELDEDLGLAEGQEVQVTVRIVPPAAGDPPGAGLLRTAGALADDEEWDRIMEEVYQARRVERRPRND